MDIERPPYGWVRANDGFWYPPSMPAPPEPVPTEPGWYQGGNGISRQWDGVWWVPLAGWYADQAFPGTYRYWNGSRWTGRRSAVATARYRKIAGLLSLVGVAATAWGWMLLAAVEVPAERVPGYPPGCDANGPIGFPNLWVPWLALLPVAGGMALLWRSNRLGDRLIPVLACTWVGIAAVAFPAVPFFLSAANCSL